VKLLLEAGADRDAVDNVRFDSMKTCLSSAP